MKRLRLEAFKAQNINKNKKQATDKLLGQVLGDCHDDAPSDGGGSNCASSDTACQGNSARN